MRFLKSLVGMAAILGVLAGFVGTLLFLLRGVGMPGVRFSQVACGVLVVFLARWLYKYVLWIESQITE